jgi:hypothetical protein
MRILLAATVAASALAIGAGMEPAVSLPLEDGADNPGSVHKVQQTLPPAPSQDTEKGKMRPDERGGMRSKERGGPREGLGERPRGYIDGGREWRRGEREWRGGDRDFRRGDRGEWRGDRGGWREDRDWRRYGGRRYFEGRPGFGYRIDCGWLRRRALETGSRYWWRRYRDCIH